MKILLIIFTLLFSATVLSEDINAIDGQLRIYNFKYQQEEVIPDPLTMSSLKAKEFIPQIEGSDVIFEEFISQGFMPYESIFYTYYKLLTSHPEIIKQLNENNK